jgi:stage IV sporulation protein FB
VLAEPPRTSYDLNFNLFGFPIRIHPLFWLGAVLIGAWSLDAGLEYLLLWILVVFVSIVVHELGHAFAFRRFGSDSHIVLWIFGGLAVPHSGISGRWRRILVALAGPFAGFLLCGLLYGSQQLTGWLARINMREITFLYSALVLVNIYWGVLNLFPVYPLDGGQVSRELCEGKWRGRGLRVSLQISVWVAGAAAVYSLVCWLEMRSGGGPLSEFVPWWARGTLWTAILFAILAVQSYQMLQQIGRGGYYYEPADDRVPWER